MPLAIILSLVAYQILYVFVHLTVYAVLMAAFGIGGGAATALEIIFLILSISFTVATFVAFRYTSAVVTRFYQFAAYWFGLINFLFGGAVLWFFAENIFDHFNVYVSPSLIAVITLGAMFLVHLYGTWNSRRAEVKKISVTIPNMPAAWRGRKIVFVSDVHLGNVQRAHFAAKVVRRIEALKPEIVFIGGDMFDGGACDPAALVAPFRNLSAPKGVYFISGNHEFYVRNFEKAFDAIRDTGIRIIHDEKIDIDGVQVIGVDFRSAHKKEDFYALLAKICVDPSRPSILLKHEPDNLPIAEAAGISIGFFGHTHQGQIFPLNYITRQMYRGFDYGLKRLSDMQVYTSSGVGTWGPPLRLGTKSEIILVEFT